MDKPYCPVRVMRRKRSDSVEPLLDREWLVTNGLGGYASGTVSNACTRRYHGLLVAALAAPFGRTMMLNHLAEEFRLKDGAAVPLGGEELAGAGLAFGGANYLVEFRIESRIPIWRFEIDGVVLEKRILLPHLQNTVMVRYAMLRGSLPVRLKLRPAVNFRGHDAPVSAPLAEPYALEIAGDRYSIAGPGGLPPLRMALVGARPAFTAEGKRIREILYRLERSRGYESTGDLWSPGYFRVDILPHRPATLVASTESWEVMLALTPDEALAADRERCHRLVRIAAPAARSGLAAELVMAADQFIITPAGRTEDSARARAFGDEVRTVIAGYHWFTDWGRDTMISLEGLTLITGRQNEARQILRTFAHYVRDGLIPNLFPEGKKEGLYHTADASLWFFHALDRYLEATGDVETLRILLPKLREIYEQHCQGTRFGIHVDPADGLLCQGAPGYQLTWMDAKVGDWVVTPRRGKAVEINALWHNALCLLERWVAQEDGEAKARPIRSAADRARDSFNRKFWNAETGWLYDVVDGENGNDPACRPNQIFAIALPHPPLDPARWPLVLGAVEEKLLTPVGLRSLAPGHPDYKPKYDGDLHARDAAYHQGTVWSWLIGPFIDAWLKTYPGKKSRARQFLDGFNRHLGEACLSSISEVFDAEEPFLPRGCVAQAWGVAEVLRCLVKTAE